MMSSWPGRRGVWEDLEMVRNSTGIPSTGHQDTTEVDSGKWSNEVPAALPRLDYRAQGQILKSETHSGQSCKNCEWTASHTNGPRHGTLNPLSWRPESPRSDQHHHKLSYNMRGYDLWRFNACESRICQCKPVDRSEMKASRWAQPRGSRLSGLLSRRQLGEGRFLVPV